ncbi:hypothetical protein RN001_006773 [Aquatica leii]|uniref:Uncharacterized protein n=1 Tax=Aquatica leii TaxID=1421715 RepID=A0AAN7SK16_9COLE|nr:hypothetical protein RN001_006773 [Aquatica leii]
MLKMVEITEMKDQFTQKLSELTKGDLSDFITYDNYLRIIAEVEGVSNIHTFNLIVLVFTVVYGECKNTDFEGLGYNVLDDPLLPDPYDSEKDPEYRIESKHYSESEQEVLDKNNVDEEDSNENLFLEKSTAERPTQMKESTSPIARIRKNNIVVQISGSKLQPNNWELKYLLLINDILEYWALWIGSALLHFCARIIPSLSDDNVLHIGGIFPLAGEGGWQGGQACMPAANLALEDVNKRKDLLPGYVLKLHSNDSEVSDVFQLKTNVSKTHKR